MNLASPQLVGLIHGEHAKPIAIAVSRSLIRGEGGVGGGSGSVHPGDVVNVAVWFSDRIAAYQVRGGDTVVMTAVSSTYAEGGRGGTQPRRDDRRR